MVFVDTDLVINFLRRRPKPVVIKAQAAMKALFDQYGEVKVTLFTVGELYEGIFLSKNPARNIRIIEDFLGKFTTVNFSRAAAIEYGRISAELQKAGTPIGNIDELIASIVIDAKDALYTRNIDHFEKIAGLKSINWDVP
ncbi:MAG: type II toxin-antitoxin system VapC family toxin [Candidatus Lokiarchaeota archaeon]|nr:type II toxin-antitoxin system VapC family toxin [Candidatus Lokiarchaeota archaeon]